MALTYDRKTLTHPDLEGGTLHLRRRVGFTCWEATQVLWPCGARKKADKWLETNRLIVRDADRDKPYLDGMTFFDSIK